MKRFILSALLLAFTSIFVFGCSDSGDDSSSAPIPTATTVEPSAPAESVTAIDLNNPDTLVGTYEITFFATNGAGYLPISTDCAKYNAEYKAELSPAVECSIGQVDNMTGEGTISKDSSGNYQIITKVQLSQTGAFGPSGIGASTAPESVYNYTVYTPIPATAIDASGINVAGTVKGTSGRKLTKKFDQPEDTYSFKLSGGNIENSLVDNSVTPAKVRVIMKKKNDEVVALEENKPYTNPAITGFLPVAQ